MQNRFIVLDTETTGLDAVSGDRIVEIACLELDNEKPTSKTFQTYVNPERDSHPRALQVHGLTTAFLADKPKFAEQAEAFLAFIKDATLVIHNAPFDMGFLNEELKRTGRESLTNALVDTRLLANTVHSRTLLVTTLLQKGFLEDDKIVQEEKTKGFSGDALIAVLVANDKFRVNSLDRLCQFYGISLDARAEHHGALLDCELLAGVYERLKKDELRLAKESCGFFQKAPEAKEEMGSSRSLTLAHTFSKGQGAT